MLRQRAIRSAGCSPDWSLSAVRFRGRFKPQATCGESPVRNATSATLPSFRLVNPESVSKFCYFRKPPTPCPARNSRGRVETVPKFMLVSQRSAVATQHRDNSHLPTRTEEKSAEIKNSFITNTPSTVLIIRQSRSPNFLSVKLRVRCAQKFRIIHSINAIWNNFGRNKKNSFNSLIDFIKCFKCDCKKIQCKTLVCTHYGDGNMNKYS